MDDLRAENKELRKRIEQLEHGRKPAPRRIEMACETGGSDLAAAGV
ncbi:hypothetical protein JL101_035480 (plasmid) [Skermanella rosea]|nr:hypothetical protein [Skermanella rosea]UEM08101.1 hypothetical protein JL101_035480 [Skermanella rosea]